MLPHKALPNLEELFNQLIHCRHIVTVYIFGGTSTAVSSHKALPNLEELPNQLIHCWNVIFARSSPALTPCGIVDGVGSYPFCSPNRSSISHSPGSSTYAPLGLTPLPIPYVGRCTRCPQWHCWQCLAPPPSFFTQQMIKMLMVMRRLHSFAWPCHSRCNKTIKLGVEETRLQLKYQSSYLLKIHFPLGLRPTTHCQ